MCVCVCVFYKTAALHALIWNTATHTEAQFTRLCINFCCSGIIWHWAVVAQLRARWCGVINGGDNDDDDGGGGGDNGVGGGKLFCPQQLSQVHLALSTETARERESEKKKKKLLGAQCFAYC